MEAVFRPEVFGFEGEGVRVNQANYDSFQPCVRISLGSFDLVIIRNDPKMINILHNLIKYMRNSFLENESFGLLQSQNYLMSPLVRSKRVVAC